MPDHVAYVNGDLALTNRVLAGSFDAYNRVSYGVASVAALKALATPDGPIQVITKGYYAAGDGGWGVYRWDAASVAADNYGTVHQPSSLPAAGRWLLLYADEVNTLQFGVYNDGTVSATNLARFQAAINFCQTNLVTLRISQTTPSHAIILAASGGAGLSITSPIRMIGAGLRFTDIYVTGLTVGQFALDVDGTAFGTFEYAEIGGFTIRAASTGDSMRVKNASLSRFFDIGVRHCRHGITYTGTRCFSNVFERVVGIGSITGNTFNMAAHGGGGQHTFSDCTFAGDTGFNLSTDTITDTVDFYDCNFEGCTTNSLYIGGTVYGLGIFGGRTEGCTGNDFQINTAAAMTVTGLCIESVTFSASNGGALDRIVLGGAGGTVRGFSVTDCTVTHGGHAFSGKLVNLNGEGESGEICNNWLDGLKASCAPINGLRSGIRCYSNEANDGKFPDRSVPIQATAQVITAVGNAILAAGDYVQLNNTSGGSLTLTSAPTIADGLDGQSISIMNVGADNVVIQDQGTLAASNLRLTGNTVTLGPRDSLTLRYDSTVGDWVQTTNLVNVL